MTIEKLRAHYEKVWRADASFGEERDFIRALLDDHHREVLEFHFGLLRNHEHWSLYCDIRAAFEDHGPPAEPFLIEKFQTEEDPGLRGDALQLLGHMRSKSVRALAEDAATADAETLRYRGVIVLGWMGTIRNMKTVLNDRVLHDPSPFVRGNAATAFRQIWYERPRAKEPAIDLLGKALEVEENDEVICSIVVTLQTIMKRRFGIREPNDGPDFVGEPAEAKKRALRSVARWRRSQD